MLMTYVGPLGAATPPGRGWKSVGPGESLEVPDENLAARLVATGEWVRADDGPDPVETVTGPPAPQVGG